MHDVLTLLLRNSPQDLLLATALSLGVYLAMSTARRVLAVRVAALARTTVARVDDVIADVIRATHSLTMIVVSANVALRQLTLSDRLESWLHHALLLVLFLQAGRWASTALRTWLKHRINDSLAREDGSTVTNLRMVAFVLRVTVWMIVLLLTLDNLGVNITALVASLGIGGIAVALAAQNILGDLFASLSISLDKPFVIGDFVEVDALSGTVKHVGLKTTRLQSLSGEELVFSNADLLRSRIRNHKKMTERRVTFHFGVAASTALDLLPQIQQAVREVIDTQPDARFDRAHFTHFNADQLAFEVVYFMRHPRFHLYRDTQQAINIGLLQRLGQLGVTHV